MVDSDSEYEEIEYLVYADFKNQLAPHQLKHDSASIKLIGIESDSPMAEINGNIFKGIYDTAMGTNVFFEKDKDNVPGDPLFETTCRQQYKYVNKTDKVINFERVYVEKLPPDPEQVIKQEDNQSEAVAQPLKLNINYKAAIRKFCEDEE